MVDQALPASLLESAQGMDRTTNYYRKRLNLEGQQTTFFSHTQMLNSKFYICVYVSMWVWPRP